MTEDGQPVSAGGYVFENVEVPRELSRLRAIEAIFDPRTRELLRATGELAGKRILEVGAGSMARFLSQEVGPSGRVVAVDLSPRFLVGIDGVEVVADDVRNLPIGSYVSDLVHARYVFIHNKHPEGVLDAMFAHAAPSAFVLLEEPDFTTARALSGPDEFMRVHEAVGRAIVAMFRARAMDPAFGLCLASLLEQRGVEVLAIESEAHVAPGGAPLAHMMGLSTQQLA